MKKSGRKVGRPRKNTDESHTETSTADSEYDTKKRETYLLQIHNLHMEINNIKLKETTTKAAKDNILLEMDLLERRINYLKKIIELYSKRSKKIASKSKYTENSNGPSPTPMECDDSINKEARTPTSSLKQKAVSQPEQKPAEKRKSIMDADESRRKVKLLREKVKKYLIETVGKDVIICNIHRITRQESEAAQPEDNVKLLRVNVLGPNNIWVQDVKSPEMPKVASRYMRYYKVKYKCTKYEITNKQPVVVDDDPDFVILTPSGDLHVGNKKNLFCIGSIGEISINEVFELTSREPFTIQPVSAEVVMERKHISLLQPLILETLANDSEPDSIPCISMLAECTSKQIEQVLPDTEAYDANMIIPDSVPVIVKHEEFVIENDPNFSCSYEERNDQNIIDLTEIL